jgi:serine/threonine-protein kinase
LVLYELFTGKRAFEAATPAEIVKLQGESSPTTPSSHVEGLDQAVERIILRCLESEPSQRPVSALAVAVSLPGGDPLAAALAAGETPSPEMVAAAGSTGLLRPTVAWPLVAIILIVVGVMAWLGPKTGIYGHVDFVKPRQALEENARDIARNLGYTEAAAFVDCWFHHEMSELNYVAQQDPEPDWAAESDPIQRTIWFAYAQSPIPVGPHVDYPQTVAGAFVIKLDLQGRLLVFQAVPRMASFLQAEPPPVDWSILFEASGLEIDDFEPTQPRRHPDVFADSRRAWNGTMPHWGGMPVRIEAAATAGRPVYFEIVVPWDPYWSAETFAATPEFERPDALQGMVGAGVLLLVVGGAILIAYRNMRVGRGDSRGAFRLAFFVLTLDLLVWLVAGTHVPGVEQEFARFGVGLGRGLAWATVTWILYMALEPSARKLWSGGLVSWNRMLGGRIGDPMVGRDVLIGLIVGVSLNLISSAAWWFGQHYMEWPPGRSDMLLGSISGGRFLLGDIFGHVLAALTYTLGLVMAFVIFHLILRKTWLAAGFFLLTGAAQVTMYLRNTEGVSGLPAVAFALLVSGLLTIMLIRFGLLTFVAMWVSVNLFNTFPFTLDYNAPYFTSGLFGLLVLAALATLACRVSLGRNLAFK